MAVEFVQVARTRLQAHRMSATNPLTYRPFLIHFLFNYASVSTRCHPAPAQPMRNLIRVAGWSPASILRVISPRFQPFRHGAPAIVLACLAPALAPAGAPVAEPDAAAETITSPGFAVDHRHCDGSESTPVVLPLPRPLGRQHAGASLEVEARLDPDGRVAAFRRLAGSAQLEEELGFSLQRSRFAPGSSPT